MYLKLEIRVPCITKTLAFNTSLSFFFFYMCTSEILKTEGLVAKSEPKVMRKKSLLSIG